MRANVVDRDLLEGLAIDVVHDEIESTCLLKDGIAAHEVRVARVEEELGFQTELVGVCGRGKTLP